MSGVDVRFEGGSTTFGLVRPPSTINAVTRATYPPASATPGSQLGPIVGPVNSDASTITFVGGTPPSAFFT